MAKFIKVKRINYEMYLGKKYGTLTSLASLFNTEFTGVKKDLDDIIDKIDAITEVYVNVDQIVAVDPTINDVPAMEGYRAFQIYLNNGSKNNSWYIDESSFNLVKNTIEGYVTSINS